jgi:hydroxypyruvate isomerase
VVEPINHYDIPTFFLNRTDDTLRLLDEVGLPNVRVQYDIYHAQREEGELTATFRKHLARIGHIQIADNPGRHQPGTGEINFPFLFRQLDECGYAGWIGLEYIPSPNTAASLAWLREYGIHA